MINLYADQARDLATRAQVLLGALPSEERSETMDWMESQMRAHSLLTADPPGRKNLAQFVEELIGDNPIAHGRMMDVRTIQEPSQVESLERVISILLPQE